MKQANGEEIVVWANSVAEARYSLTVPEQRLILWLAAQIEKEDDALKEWTLGVLEMQEIAGSNNGRVYEQVEAVCNRLQSRVLEIRLDDRAERIKINWMHRIRYNDGQGTVSLRFHDDLKDALLKLKERFSMLPLKTVFRLRGGYAMRWYELLVARKYLKTFTMEVEELRAWLGIEAGELPMVKDLRKRALDVPKAELDAKADLTFTYAPTKVGKRITGWTFTVKPNRPRPVQRSLPLRDAEPEPSPEQKAQNLAVLADAKAKLRGAA